MSDEKRVKEWREFCEKFAGPSESDNLYICGAGISTFHIDPYGKMSACEMTRFQNHDLRCGPFEEGWSKSIPEFLTLKPEGQCPGWGWLENGNPEAPVEYLCQIAHLRAEAFNLKKS
ncbi:MAG: hypothetical protein JRC66_10785 [Deltaproteobacteria bacterium]|nr:hypothetical protein [Deltaproteobacteria bacterium]